jgi:hypothetical protein
MGAKEWLKSFARVLSTARSGRAFSKHFINQVRYAPLMPGVGLLRLTIDI